MEPARSAEIPQLDSVITDAVILDVGCGTGALSNAILAHGANSVIGVDPSLGYVSYATSYVASGGRNITFEVGDAMHFRFADNSFDAVVFGLVLNFILEPARGIGENATRHQKGRHCGCVRLGIIGKEWS